MLIARMSLPAKSKWGEPPHNSINTIKLNICIYMKPHFGYRCDIVFIHFCFSYIRFFFTLHLFIYIFYIFLCRTCKPVSDQRCRIVRLSESEWLLHLVWSQRFDHVWQPQAGHERSQHNRRKHVWNILCFVCCSAAGESGFLWFRGTPTALVD